MKTKPAVKVAAAVCLGLVAYHIVVDRLLDNGTAADRLKRDHARYVALFKAGDTNAPLLAMGWFTGHAVYSCRVSQSGYVYAPRSGYGRNTLRFHFDNQSRSLLEAAINALPASSKLSLPRDRQILISGVQSNQWFNRRYDRANVPPEVERLYELTRAYLAWFIPIVDARVRAVPRSSSQRDPNSFAIAPNASVAVSVCANTGLQMWDLNGKSSVKLGGLDKLPTLGMIFHGIAAISPDGRSVIIADRGALFAVEWKRQELVWQKSAMAWGNMYGADRKTLAVGNRGQSLFIAENNSVQRWNLTNGVRLGVLATNATGIKFLQTSWNGEVLIAGFGDNSFTLWNTVRDEPVFRFSQPGDTTCVALSPNGQQIVLSSFEERKLVVHTWQREERSEFPLRAPYDSSFAYLMCWSPQGDRLAAHTDPGSIVIYETIGWKPIAHWPCGIVASGSQFVFNKEGTLFQLADAEIKSLDVAKLKSPGE